LAPKSSEASRTLRKDDWIRVKNDSLASAMETKCEFEVFSPNLTKSTHFPKGLGTDGSEVAGDDRQHTQYRKCSADKARANVGGDRENLLKRRASRKRRVVSTNGLNARIGKPSNHLAYGIGKKEGVSIGKQDHIARGRGCPEVQCCGLSAVGLIEITNPAGCD